MVLKDVERKMLSELIKHSRRSDRELAKAVGISQPTATRIRTKLEKEGYIKEYTTVPDFNKIGYALLSFTLLKMDIKHSLPSRDVAAFRKAHYETINKNPSATLLVKRGMGLGYDAVVMSLHRDYSSCDKFQTFIRQNMMEKITNIDTFLINLEEEQGTLPFSFNLLANQMLALLGNS